MKKTKIAEVRELLSAILVHLLNIPSYNEALQPNQYHFPIYTIHWLHAFLLATGVQFLVCILVLQESRREFQTGCRISLLQFAKYARFVCL